MRHKRDRRAGRWVTGVAAGAVLVALGVGRHPAAAAAGTSAADTEPATQPTAVAAPTDDGGPSRPGRPGGRRRGSVGILGGGRFGGPQVTDADRVDALNFLAQHAPRQYESLKSLPDGDPDRIRLEGYVARAFVNYQRSIKPDDPALYAVILKRVEAEDVTFGLANQFRHATGDARAALRQQLHAQVAACFAIGLQERKLRLARLERTVKKEKDQLAADLSNSDQLIDARLNRLATQGEGGRGRGEQAGDEPEPVHVQPAP